MWSRLFCNCGQGWRGTPWGLPAEDRRLQDLGLVKREEVEPAVLGR
jgi:hypothetical protein